MLSGSDGMGPHIQGPQQRLVKAPGMWSCCGPGRLPVPSLANTGITPRSSSQHYLLGQMWPAPGQSRHGTGVVQNCQPAIPGPR